jgi:LysR family glycine cleavage system transcriptional activator
MRRLPSFHALRAFEAAARLESFLLASAELRLTPSAISHQVRGLERHFGRPLFLRRNRQVTLTEAGRRLLTRLSPAFDAIEAACAELRPAPGAGALALHCVPSFASKFLGSRLPAFLKAHPEVGLHLSASADAIDLARQEEFDLAIAYGTPPTAPGIVVEPLGRERIVALAAPALATTLRLDDPRGLAEVALIESVRNPVRWPEWFQLNGLPLPMGGARPSFDRGALAVSAAVQGLGLALESTRFAQQELAAGELVILGGARFRPIEREMHFLCYRAARRALPKIAAFRRWLLELTAAD